MTMTGQKSAAAVGRVLGRLLALGGALALAACAAETANEASKPAETPTKVAVAPPEPPPPPELMGLDGEAVIRILGEPVFRRHDEPALLMRYRGEGCILDLFLYPAAGDTPAGGTAVEHVEARTADGKPAVTESCISAVMKARAATTGDSRG